MCHVLCQLYPSCFIDVTQLHSPLQPPPPDVCLPILCFKMSFFLCPGALLCGVCTFSLLICVAWVSPGSLNWPEVPLRMVVCLSQWLWDKLVTCPGCDHDFAWWQLRWAPAASVTPVCRRKWLWKAKRNKNKLLWYYFISAEYFHCSWAEVALAPLCNFASMVLKHKGL